MINIRLFTTIVRSLEMTTKLGVQCILAEKLGMQQIAVKFFFILQSTDKMQRCFDLCTELRQLAAEDKIFYPVRQLIDADIQFMVMIDPGT